ncbi:IPT/TIG domain-containing protein [Chitinophaga skermanii]|uniref:IPT/TIG domain-containing protein n=1 Tax=Chitinophaga skermanii TaxID=331697 RepID=A0A327QYQ2_9BACT|nr:IPT/TIG domain-containing protein [Chitinophaga skermanii]RAJ08553.1 IPT/TIG domain-containing protein [Chitinophaga skermanii]
MKKHIILYFLMFVMCAGFLFTSCEKDETPVPPTLERVRLIKKDSTTSIGYTSNMYAIMGQHLGTTIKVLFNGTEAYLNPTLITNTSIIVSIPADAPWKDQENKITVITLGGEAKIDFKIQQPGPEITNFDPKAAGTGDVITITGKVFDGLERVMFDSTKAEIVSFTSTEIKVKVPAGIVQAFIHVFTPGGVTTSKAAFGFKYVVFDDDLAPSWWKGGWGNTTDWASTQIVKRGTRAIKVQYTGAWSGFQTGYSGADITLSGYSAIKISLYGMVGSNGRKVKLVLNGNYDIGFEMILKEGEWQDFTIPLSSMGNPAKLLEIVLQEAEGNATTGMYVDDIGLI